MSVLRGKVPFIKLASMGELDDKGKVIFSVGYSGRITGKQPIPLCSVMIPLMDQYLNHCRWDDDGLGAADLKAFKKYVNGLELELPKGKSK